MDDKKAAKVLLNLLNSKDLEAEEKEALKTAIGILGWTALSDNRTKARREKKEHSSQWA